LPRDDEDRVVVNQPDFRRATLPTIPFEIGSLRFRGDAQFDRVTFEDEVWFVRATFEGEVWFNDATFQDAAWFDEATFQNTAWFEETVFQNLTRFERATFKNAAMFRGTTFQGVAVFDGATFHDLAGFDSATFQQEAVFSGATFQREVRFGGMSFRHAAKFEGVTFERASQVGPLFARQVILDDAVFRARVQVESATAALCARRAQFPAGVHFRLRWASVILDEANLAAPAIIAGVPPLDPQDPNKGGFSRGHDEEEKAHRWERLPPGPPDQRWRPRLLSLRRADVAGLRLADVDLRACWFTGSHNLDRLRVEGIPQLTSPPGRWRARRLTVAEEQYWRAQRRQSRRGGWYPRACQPPASWKVEAPSAIAPVQIAAIYRELRKGREDTKDEPGAADFYYGEMEMRRHGRATPAAERLILTMYWLVAGYGLRAWRALVALTVTIGLVGVGFSQVGFHHPHPSLLVNWLYALQATVSLEGKARQLTGQLTLPGELLRVGLRLTGPVLLALALLSIRNRVKR
jgi:uncharacterized protein YjbI with pentapeptide repeats